jgi:hypothetical protein
MQQVEANRENIKTHIKSEHEQIVVATSLHVRPYAGVKNK